MKLRWPWQKRAPAHDLVERRATGSGFTAEVISARASWITGARAIAELTGTAQAAISLWEGGLSLADVTGTDLLDRRTLAVMARSLALRGESLHLIREGRLVPCSDWEVRTRDTRPAAYRVTVAEAGGGRSQTVLADEVLHTMVGVDASAPWAGVAPLKRARLTAEMLHEVEEALRDTYRDAPLGSQIVPYPESAETDTTNLGRSFRGQRGRVLLRESVHVVAASGPAPQADWRPQSTSPDLERAMSAETLAAARESVLSVFGVLPGLFNASTTGPMVREAQRHLAQWTLQPVAGLIAEETTDKLGVPVQIDTLRPLQAFDAGGRSRALLAIIGALAAAKEANVDPADALKLVDWGNEV